MVWETGFKNCERLFRGFLFRVYLFLVHELNFQIISNSKNGNLFYSSSLIKYLMPNDYLKMCFQRIYLPPIEWLDLNTN